MKTIQTHQHVDLDCLVSAWLVKRFIFSNDAVIVFDRNASGHFDAVVDIGEVHDEAALRFDHHMIDYEAESATSLVARVLSKRDNEALEPLIELVTDGDLGWNTPEVKASRAFGLHAMVSSLKVNGLDDYAVYAEIEKYLNMYADRLFSEAENRSYVRNTNS